MSEAQRRGWQAKLASLLFAIFCFELGAFLVVCPWTEFWDHHYFSWIQPDSPDHLAVAQWWHSVWLSPMFRGAISGIGFTNLYIALSSVFSLRRYAEPPADAAAKDDHPISVE
jgi:hypothetical protein